MTKPTKLKLLLHLLGLPMLIFLVLMWKCPAYYFFAIPCPTCGMTRALYSAITLDFAAALSYHPLFFLAPPLIIYLPHRRIFSRKIAPKLEVFVLTLILALFIIVYIVRIF